MPSNRFAFKALLLACTLAAGPLAAQDEPWYRGLSDRFWGVANSLGIRGNLPGSFSVSSSSSDGTSAFNHPGTRTPDPLALESSQAGLGNYGVTNCSDPLASEAYRSCYGPTWTLSGVATVPVSSGLSLYGRLGLHYWQKGLGEETAVTHRNLDDLGRVLGIGLSYELNRAVTFHAESERYSDLTGNGSTGPGSSLGLDASVHSIGLSIKF